MIYLDNAASTPVLDEVFREMIPYLKESYGNPSSLHKFGRDAMYAIQKARKQVAGMINANQRDVIFTSGGTEANNLAIKGAALHMREINPRKKHIVTSSIEHEAVLEPIKDLERNGFEVTYLPVTAEGKVEPTTLENAISEQKTALVCIMFANNEVGSIQPIIELAKITHSRGGNAIFHTDAVQAVGKIPIDVRQMNIDLLSISSHKINGPKGVGALFISNGLKIDPLIHGGGQEYMLRSGTENVYGIIGFGKACEIASQRLSFNSVHMLQLRNYLIDKIINEIPNCRLNGSVENRIPNNAHFTFSKVNGEDLIIKLDEYGIAASTGSACSVKKRKSSHVLKAMGFTFEEITGSLRLSIGVQNTKREIDQAVSTLSEIVKQLRIISPFKS
jgi:cysteine desulfurase